MEHVSGEFIERLGLNSKKHVEGDVVYFVSQEGNRRYVNYGTVLENYPSDVCIQLYSLKDTRIINGIPAKDFKTPTEWKKLPKGWTYDTKLFEETSEPLPNNAESYKINNADNIRRAIKDGVLVRVQDRDFSVFETQIDKRMGWRVIRSHPYYEKYHHAYLCVPSYRVYATYANAEEEIEICEREWKRQSELSDREWSIEKIDEVLDMWAYAKNIPAEYKKQCRDWILSKDKVEDIVVRLWGNDLQWKYDRNKHWMTIDLEF